MSKANSTKTNAKAACRAPKVDVYARVTDRIIKDLEAGVRPWAKPWSAHNTAAASGA